MPKYRIREFVRETKEILSEEVSHVSPEVNKLFDMGFEKVKLYCEGIVVVITKI